MAQKEHDEENRDSTDDDHDDDGEESGRESSENDESDAELDAEDDGDAEDDDLSEAEAASKSPSQRPKPTKLTPGQRLAAAKARKAAQKTASRGRDAELMENKALKQATVVASWAQNNRAGILIGLVVVAIGLGSYIGITAYTAAQAEGAANLLRVAIETANADIVPDSDTASDDESDEETYASVAERAEHALPRFKKVVDEEPESPAAIWARLGMGAALLELDRTEDALKAFQDAQRLGGDDPTVAWRALEGIIFCHEMEEDWEQAEQTIEQLTEIARGDYEPFAKYHRARLLKAQGENERAIEILRELVEELGTEGEEEEAQLTDLKSQAELLLTELDPASAPERPSGMDFDGLGGSPSDQLEQIRRMIELQQQGGGGDLPFELPLPEGGE